ncbi:MAG: endonuclease/exonuclease/phosphatase family protein [Planctomycetota bacterium]|nr:endonuclease/exonuclease/phosphatase family protein [Planctomycetota bacterium]
MVDGQFNDWPEADEAGNRIQVDGTRVWIDMHHTGTPVNLQHLDAPLELVFKVEGQALFESTLTFSPVDRGMGVALATRDQDGQVINESPYELDVVFAPTTASNRFELVIDFSSLVTKPARCKLVGLADEVLSFDLVPREEDGPGTAQVISIPRCPADAFRVMSWNVRFGGLLEQAERAGRILKALQPDIILLQELVDEQSAGAVASFLDETLGTRGGAWQVAASPIGSRLRSMVAARGKAPPVMVNMIRMQTDESRFVRAAAMKVDLGDERRLLACSIHLRCCGSAGGKEDLQRVEEASMIQHSLEQVLEEWGCQDIVIGGDLNLVGSRLPLQVLATGLDPSGADLAVAHPLQLDGDSLATWADPSGNAASAFTPGRLDWLLYGGSSLESVQAFILDTSDLSMQALDEHQLEAEDAPLLSDHFPVILDARKRIPEP